jgi:cardiolipin synthase
MKNFVMALTYTRIFMGPIIFLVSAFGQFFFLAFLLFIFAALSDFFDGYLARRHKVESQLGKLLDPIADKVLLTSALFSIITITDDLFISAIALIIILRELWVSGIREFTALNKINDATNVSKLAKIKTATQFAAILSFYYTFSINSSLGIFLSSFLLFLSMLITVKTALDYTTNTLKKI